MKKEITEGTEPSQHEKKESKKTTKDRRIKELEKQLEEKTREAAENYEKFLRSYAELENFKKRIQREKEEAIRFANEELVKELLPIIDNLERALEQVEGSGDVNSLKEGISLTLQQFLKTLNRFGLEQITSVGERFDPNKHEAVAVEDTKEHDDGIVLKEFQKAYFFKDRLLRPAMVTVSKGEGK